ncbi:MAG: hypothetical protein LQ343_001036 [Gyalolechia ehrenbergii]|nr:MAG: hypothetical protein LQ343_001036 [Gyalolechia ehrenbergii]
MTLYAFGSNGRGQLGIGNTEDTCIPQPCKLLEEQQWPSPICAIKGGGSHTLVLLESGELYTSGSLIGSRAGLPPLAKSTSKFSRASSDEFGGSKVKLCSALWEASVFVTVDDEVYVFGSGVKGELGLGKEVASYSGKLERFWPQEEQIVGLSSGMSHTVVVLSNGDVYGWGNGRKGQLGEPAGIIWEPRKIQKVAFEVVRATCGREFSYLVGPPKDGQHVILGSDKFSIRSAAPAAIPGWKDLGASWGSIFVISRSDDFIAWGRNDHGQTGPERHHGKCVQIATGSEHVLVLTKGGDITAWGWGEHGNCGLGVDWQGDVKGWWNTLHPYRFGKRAKVVGIAAGCATSFVWTMDDAYDQYPQDPKEDGMAKFT